MPLPISASISSNMLENIFCVLVAEPWNNLNADIVHISSSRHPI